MGSVIIETVSKEAEVGLVGMGSDAIIRSTEEASAMMTKVATSP